MTNIRPVTFLTFLLLLFSITYYSCIKEVAPLPRKQAVCDSLSVQYAVHIKPIIDVECVNTGCHSAGGGSSGFDMSTYALVKAKVDDSTFSRRVLQGDVYGWMPAGGLPASDREKIKCWISNGAPNN